MVIHLSKILRTFRRFWIFPSDVKPLPCRSPRREPAQPARGRLFCGARLERARGRRAEATPRSYFEMEGGPEPAGGLTVTTENKMLA